MTWRIIVYDALSVQELYLEPFSDAGYMALFRTMKESLRLPKLKLKIRIYQEKDPVILT